VEISVRNMEFDDIHILADGFGIKQGWKDKSVELFTQYYDEQSAGQRHVLVAHIGDSVAGYVTLLPNDKHGPFADKNIPTICDFNVLKIFQRRGVGTALMDAVEKLAKKSSNEICLGVGLYSDYGDAQRMYVKRGYIPDGSGIWYKNRNLSPYEPCANDDELLLYMSKNFSRRA